MVGFTRALCSRTQPSRHSDCQCFWVWRSLLSLIARIGICASEACDDLAVVEKETLSRGLSSRASYAPCRHSLQIKRALGYIQHSSEGDINLAKSRDTKVSLIPVWNLTCCSGVCDIHR
jgi:hypothetical protein